MSLTPSASANIGNKATQFALLEPKTGSVISLQSYENRPFMLVFMCNHCPYVVHILQGLTATARKLEESGIATIAISSNSIESHPQDGPDKMAQLASQMDFPFPYLYDESQEVAHAYGAVCTPDLYLFNTDHELYYRGQLDDSRPGSNIPVTGESMLGASASMLAGEDPPGNTKPSVGCSIKWKAA